MTYVDKKSIQFCFQSHLLSNSFFSLLKNAWKSGRNLHLIKIQTGAEDRVMVSDDVVVDPLLKSVIPLCHQICLKSMLAVRTSYQGNPNGAIGLQIPCGSFDRKLLYIKNAVLSTAFFMDFADRTFLMFSRLIARAYLVLS